MQESEEILQVFYYCIDKIERNFLNYVLSAQNILRTMYILTKFLQVFFPQGFDNFEPSWKSFARLESAHKFWFCFFFLFFLIDW